MTRTTEDWNTARIKEPKASELKLPNIGDHIETGLTDGGPDNRPTTTNEELMSKLKEVESALSERRTL